MGVWSTILKYGGKAAKGTGKAVLATGKNVGEAALHPSQTLRGAGQAVKTAAVGGAIGYVGWEKLTTDKSVVRIVSDAVIGEPATDALADTAEDVRGLTDKAGEAVGTLSGAVAGIDSKLDGVSNFLRQASSGGGMNMLGNFVRNWIEHRWPYSRRFSHFRTFRVVGQDRRGFPRHDAHRQQCRRLP